MENFVDLEMGYGLLPPLKLDRSVAIVFTQQKKKMRVDVDVDLELGYGLLAPPKLTRCVAGDFTQPGVKMNPQCS
jgi:hypothetical protein